MNVGEMCKKTAVTVRSFDDLSAAAELMRERHIGSLIVVEPGFQPGSLKPTGILTDRDIVIAVLARGAEIAGLRVGDVMSSEVRVVQEDAPMEEALREMRRLGVRRLPVVGSQGQLVGIVTLDDILDVLATQLQDVAGSIRSEQVLEGVYRP
jgi:CBS domain-containing protein